MTENNFLKRFLYQFKIAGTLLLLFTIITGLIYPILVTGLAQILFPFSANGSLIIKDKKIIGSELIGQAFEDPKYFKSRLSATTPFPYNALASNGSNLGPANPALVATVKDQISTLKKINHKNHSLIPIDLVTASGSGLDPHISPKGAFYQIPIVAKARNLSESVITNLVHQFIEKRQFGFLGEPRINVLKLNLALNEILTKNHSNQE